MPFVSSAYTDFIGPQARAKLYRTHLRLGYHPETHDDLLVPTADRFSGMYITGVQGSGKSGLLQSLIYADIMAGHAVIVLDPHGDLVDACLSTVPDHREQETYVLDMEQEDYPFGLNLFSVGPITSSLERSQAVNRITRIFTLLWPEVASQQYLPLFLPSVIQVFLYNPGKTMVDLLTFFRDDAFRAEMLSHVADPTIQDFWKYEYDNQSESERRRRVQPLTNRLQTLFTGRSLIRNIMGQQNSLNFRKAIEAKQIIILKLPLKTIPEEAKLVGTILLSQIHNAIFSFGNVPEAQRPGVSLFVDEFSNFATTDFNELFAEGRKFGLRLVLAHQQRSQLPKFLQDSTASARTKVCFQLTPDDAREMTHFFPSSETTIKPEDIEPHVTHHLLTYLSDDVVIRTFIETYLRPLQGKRRGNRIEIEVRHLAPSVFELANGERFDNPRVPDPTWYLDNLLYQVMRERNASLPIPPEVAVGFSGCGDVFFRHVAGISPRDVSLSAQVRYPAALVAQASNASLRWTRRPEGGNEQFFHFIFHLRAVMHLLAQNPIGKLTTASPTVVGQMLASLPRRAAFVRAADTVGVIYTHDTPKPLPDGLLVQRIESIVAHTRAVYCRPRAEVEKGMLQPKTLPSKLPSSQPPTQLPPARWEETQ